MQLRDAVMTMVELCQASDANDEAMAKLLSAKGIAANPDMAVRLALLVPMGFVHALYVSAGVHMADHFLIVDEKDLPLRRVRLNDEPVFREAVLAFERLKPTNPTSEYLSRVARRTIEMRTIGRLMKRGVKPADIAVPPVRIPQPWLKSLGARTMGKRLWWWQRKHHAVK
jgi:hypothetical protein